MQKYNFIKTLTAGVALALASCPQAWAEDTCPEGKILMWNGSCQIPSGDCGTGCKYTLDSDGNLKITGSGQGRIDDTFYGNRSIKNLTIESGITTIGSNAFFNAGNIQNVEIGKGVSTIEVEAFDNIGAVNSFIMPDTITSIGNFALQSISGAPVVIPPNATIGHSWVFIYNTQVKYCTAAQITNCGANSMLYEKKNDLFYVYDQEGNVSEIYGGYENFNSNVLKEQSDKDTYAINEDGSVSIIDKDGVLLAKYAENGNLLAQYSYASDGSVYIRNGNGKLVGAKKTSPFTPAEAAALVKKGNNNTVKMIFK